MAEQYLIGAAGEAPADRIQYPGALQVVSGVATLCDMSPQTRAMITVGSGMATLFGPQIVTGAQRLATTVAQMCHGASEVTGSEVSGVEVPGSEVGSEVPGVEVGSEVPGVEVGSKVPGNEVAGSEVPGVAGSEVAGSEVAGVVAGGVTCVVLAYNAAQKALAEADDQIAALDDEIEAALANIDEEGCEEEHEEEEEKIQPDPDVEVEAEGEEKIQPNPDVEVEAEDDGADAFATPVLQDDWNKRQAMDRVFAVRGFFSLAGSRSLCEGQWHEEAQTLFTQLMNGKVTMKGFKAQRKLEEKEPEISSLKRKLAEQEDEVHSLRRRLQDKDDELMEERMCRASASRNLQWVMRKVPYEILLDAAGEVSSESGSEEEQASSTSSDIVISESGIECVDEMYRLVTEARTKANDDDDEDDE